jgi:hypothetical protein
MRERYVRPPLVADEPREGRVAASRLRAAALAAIAVAVVALIAVLIAVLVARHVGGAGDNPGIDRSPTVTASTR